MSQSEHAPAFLFPEILTAVDTSLRLAQGDLVIGYTSAMVPPYNPDALGHLVISNSCDLVRPERLAYFALVPVFDLSWWVSQGVQDRIRNRKVAGNPSNYQDVLKTISEKLLVLADYRDKDLFFLPPHAALGGSAAFANIMQILTLPMAEYESVCGRRAASMKSPWREKLGYKVGFLFSRVATWTPTLVAVQSWLERNYKSAIEKALQ